MVEKTVDSLPPEQKVRGSNPLGRTNTFNYLAAFLGTCGNISTTFARARSSSHIKAVELQNPVLSIHLPMPHTGSMSLQAIAAG